MSTTPRRLGKYELQGQLGRGGMAEVWKAFDTQLHRYVAIKLLHADLQTDPDFISRFTREARLIAALRHPNIVQIYDFHISEGDQGEESAQGEKDAAKASTTAYMVMEYIQGQTLAHCIHNTSRKGIFSSPAEVVRLFTPISLALDYAHQQGTIHRDIKPANILLDQRNTAHNPMGEPILSDFGLAKLLNASSQTVSHASFGTPLYISPEQVQNHPVSNRTDLYSLGVVLYEIFTGAPVFHGDNLIAIMMQHLKETPTEPHLVNPQLPEELSEVLLQSLAKDPQDRFPSAAAMIAAIAKTFHLPVPQELKEAISSGDDENLSLYHTLPSDSLSGLGSSLISSNVVLPDQQVAVSTNDEPVSGEYYSPATVPPVKAESTGGPLNLPDSQAQLSAQANSDRILPLPSPPLLPPPPTSKGHGKLRIAIVALAICVLVGSGLGTFFVLNHHSTASTAGTSTVVGHAFFVSSGQSSETSNVGSNDELQIGLQNIPDPPSGKSYYAWLLPDKSQSEAQPILLGKLPTNHGVVHFLYQGDNHHSNLLAISSRFLITDEDANVTPQIPSPDLSTWSYYAELPQTPAAGQQYSLVDHLRHLLASDPTLNALHLPGGLDIWTYRNIQKILEWAGSARDDWNSKDFTSMHQQIVSILDYLDGQVWVKQDVPPGTPIQAHPLIARVGLLELDPGHQEPPGYLYHIALHLNGVLTSPGVTQDQRQQATQINTALNDTRAWLEQVRSDAVRLVHLNDTQLALPSSLALLNDMVTQANNAYMGHSDPSTGQTQAGIAQVYQDVQRMATLEVKPYSK